MLYRSLLRPLLFKLPPETAHEFALHALSLGLGTAAVRGVAAASDRASKRRVSGGVPKERPERNRAAERVSKEGSSQ